MLVNSSKHLVSCAVICVIIEYGIIIRDMIEKEYAELYKHLTDTVPIFMRRVKHLAFC